MSVVTPVFFLMNWKKQVQQRDYRTHRVKQVILKDSEQRYHLMDG